MNVHEAKPIQAKVFNVEMQTVTSTMILRDSKLVNILTNVVNYEEDIILGGLNNVYTE